MRDQAALFNPASGRPAPDERSSSPAVGASRSYPSYRPSGVDWLGDVPAHWRTKRLKYAVDLINQKTEDADGLPYVGLEHIESWTGRRIESETPVEPEGIANTFRAGDVLFGKLRPYLAKAMHAREGGVCTSEALVLRPRLVAPEYLFYYALNQAFVSVVDGSTYGSKMPRANWEFIGNLPCPLPPLPEQEAIAGWLDERARRIDELVAGKRWLINLLAEQRTAIITHAVTKGLDPAAPMKPSGIDWLGDVPRHWDLKRLKFISRLQTGLTLGKKHDEDEQARLVLRPYLRVANVQDGWLDLEEITEVEVLPERVARYELRAGDVLMTEGGDFDKLGRGYVWEGQIPGCLHQNHIFAVRPDTRRLDSHFLASMLSSSHGRNYFTKTSQQTTNLASTNATKLGDFPVPLPPVPEQREIMARVDGIASKLDTLIAATESAIARLTEYRQALISAAVTGKINVCGASAAASITESANTAVDEAPVIAGRIGAKARKANKYFHRDVLAAAIIDRIGESATFGWVKLQKSLILAEGHLQLCEIESEPVRAAAGPFDNKMMRSIHAQLVRLEWYGYDKNGTPYKYAALAKAGGHADYFTRYWSGKAERFDALMALLLPMRTRSAEVLATVYSAWNDFLIEGRAVTDEALVAEVMKNWHPAKQAIPEKNWRAAPPWMRQHGLVPTGHGAHTKASSEGATP